MLLANLNLGTPSEQTWGPGLTLPFSLNLDSGGTPDTAYKYLSDAWTPTFTEDAVDEVTVRDQYESFEPSLSMSGNVSLLAGTSASLTGVSGLGRSGAAGASSDVSVFATGVDATGDAYSYFNFIQTQRVPVSGRSATGRVGELSVEFVVGTQTVLGGTEAAAYVGSVYASQDAVSIVGAAATGSARSIGVSTSAGTSVTADSAIGYGDVGILAAPDETATISGVTATGRAGFVDTAPTISVNARLTGVRGISVASLARGTGGATGAVSGSSASGAAEDLESFVYLQALMSAVQASGQVGSQTAYGSASASLSGVSASSTIGAFIVNPGDEGMPQRRKYPKRRRAVKVKRG